MKLNGKIAIGIAGLASAMMLKSGIDLLEHMAKDESAIHALELQLKNKEWVNKVLSAIEGGPWEVQVIIQPEKLPIFGYIGNSASIGVINISNSISNTVICVAHANPEGQTIKCHLENPIYIHKSTP